MGKLKTIAVTFIGQPAKTFATLALTYLQMLAVACVLVQSSGESCNPAIYNPYVYKQNVRQVIQRLNTDIAQIWTYGDIFSKPEHIGITKRLLGKGLSNLGDEIRIKKLLVPALKGCEVSLPVIGGSISRGATFVEDGNGDRIFFHAIVEWWNTVFETTGSRMSAQSISLGGVGTDYFSYCLNSHLHEDSKPKLILWELAANDRGRYNDKPYPPGQPLEQLTRNILTRPSKPALLFLNFFRAHDYMGGRCMNYEDEGGQTVANHYRVTSISWRSFVCDNIKKRTPLFTMHEIFGTDNLHPSILGHAQMAYLVIDHLKKIFLKVLRNIGLTSANIQGMEKRFASAGDMTISPILFHETSVNRPMCYTYFMYNDNEPNNTLPIQIVRSDDFHFHVFKKFKIRTDKLGGMQTNQTEQLLQVVFVLPHVYAKIVLVTHSLTGNAQVWIDRDSPVIVETDDYHMGTRTEMITTNIKKGKHLLNILSLKHGFAFCALAVI